MNISVKTIPHSEQIYETTGNWLWDSEGNLEIYISKVGDWRSEMAVAVHEIIEALICNDRGISEESVSSFDISNPELEDPGLSSDAPYHAEHMFATSVEMLLVAELGVDWNVHNEKLESLYLQDH